MTRQKILVVCGTRPEAIKLAPLILQLQASDDFEVCLCATGQHREMLAQVFELFDLVPDVDLAIMKKGQTLPDVSAAVLTGLTPVLEKFKPDRVVVHGDTNTTMSASLAAFYAGVPVAHVEAGLRTGNLYSPWPEEANRRIAGVLSDRHYAPTEQARQNLLAENLPSKHIVVTGNTVIDALLMIAHRLDHDEALAAGIAADLPTVDPDRKLILVTGHRRENFGAGFEQFCTALKVLGDREDVQLIYPVHMNPQVREPVERLLSDSPRIHLIEPLQYLPFVSLMKQAHIIISDSGGIQEEAPALGVPVLVTRDTTERPEAVDAGTVLLVGTDTDVIIDTSQRLLDDEAFHHSMSGAKNPYGDGHACEAILADLLKG